MTRTLGFLTGICLTVAIFLLVAHPRASRPPETVAEIPSPPAPEQRSTLVAAIAEPVDSSSPANEATPPASAPQAPGTAGSETADGDNASAPEPAQPTEVQAEEIQAAATVPDREDGGESGSFLFWSPFRSAWAADGFARRLTSATRVPVEVVEAGPGKYRVAFSYQDDAERLERINRIETITGLKLESP